MRVRCHSFLSFICCLNQHSILSMPVLLVMEAKLVLFFLSTLITTFFSFKALLCSAADTILPGQSLTGKQTMISQGGNFELGFFTPGNSQKYYVGIWYKKLPVQTVVWVANRDQPLKDSSSSELKLLENGNLVLLNQFKMPFWSTNTTSNHSHSSQLVMMDDGNLVLREGLEPSIIIWQSFDHFTDTWLPGAKLSYDNQMRKGQRITSWKNSEDPSPGMFTEEASHNGEHIRLWNGTRKYWTSGAWNGRFLTGIPEMGSHPRFFNFSFVKNEKESYFIYSVYNKSLVSRHVMDLGGQTKQFLWSEDTKSWNLFWCKPLRQCDVYGLCGAFGICMENHESFCQCLPGFEIHSPKDWNLHDYSNGCVRKTPLLCGNKDRFSTVSNIKLPTDPVSLAVESAENCKLACLNNCSCAAYAYRDGCLAWFGNVLNTQQLENGGDNLYLKLAASEDSSFGCRVSIILAILGSVFVVVCIFVSICMCNVKKSVKTSDTLMRSFMMPICHHGFLTAFQYKELKLATKKFSEKVGAGSFGSVFKGTLPDSTSVAVKKLEGVTQGEKQFRSEVSTLGLIQHVNLVRLRGFCAESSKRILVYDFMSNGSLDSHLFHQNDLGTLNWKTRYQIAVGIARGLAYLHEECRDRIIHCDIKPENILLDSEFSPKIADFGLAKLLGREFSHVLTTMRGTIGYLAPEWSSGVAITTKADVYSYGMMLFEIISGRRNLKQSKDGKVWFFPTWAASKISEGKEMISILDNKLKGEADIEELTRAFKVAAWCIQEEAAQRPSMGRVVQILDGFLEVHHPPIPKHLQVLVQNEEVINFFSHADSSNQILQA